MCFGGCDTDFGNCTGSIAYILEKLASFVAMTAVILCIIITVTISLGLGIGLGYNYCFVDQKIAKETDAYFTTEVVEETTLPPVEEKNSLPPGEEENNLTPAEHETPLPPIEKETTERVMEQPRRMHLMPAIKPTMSIPLNGEFDFPALLSKLRGRNKNVTLELFAT